MNAAPLLAHQLGLVVLREDVLEQRTSEFQDAVGVSLDDLNEEWLASNPIARSIVTEVQDLERFYTELSPRLLRSQSNVPGLMANAAQETVDEVPDDVIALEGLPLEDGDWLLAPYEASEKLTVLGLVATFNSPVAELRSVGTSAWGPGDIALSTIQVDDGKCLVIIEQIGDADEEYHCTECSCDDDSGCIGLLKTDPDIQDLSMYWCSCGGY